MKKILSILTLFLVAIALPNKASAWNFNQQGDPKRIVLYFINNDQGEHEMTYSSSTYWTCDFTSKAEVVNFTVRAYYSDTQYNEYYANESATVGSWSADMTLPQVSNTSFWVNGLSEGTTYRITIKGADSDANKFKFKFDKVSSGGGTTKKFTCH